MDRRSFLYSTGGIGLSLPIAGCVLFNDDEEYPDPADPDAVADEDDDGGNVAWRSFQYDAANTGFKPDSTGPGGHPEVNWMTDTWGHLTGPVVDDGAAYFGSGLHHHHVFAFDAETGEEAWRKAVGDEVASALAVDDGAVYAGSRSLYALDTETGEERWRKGLRAAAGFTVADGVAYVGSDGVERVHAFDVGTGDEVWERDVSCDVAPAVYDGAVYGSDHDTTFALDAGTGDEVWTSTLDRPVRTPPTAADDAVYVTNREGVHALDAHTGEDLWAHPGDFTRTSPAAVDGTLYVCGWDAEDGEQIARAIAVDAKTGNVEWTFEDDGLAPGDPVVVDGVIYFGSAKRLYALDAETGEERWKLQFQWPVGTPAVANETILASVGGRLVSIGRDGGGSADSDVRPDSSREPAYADSDFYFGTHGYEVTASARVTGDEGAPFDARMDVEGDVIDEDERVVFAFALENGSDSPLTITSGPPAPLGVVRLRGIGETERTITAWTDAYEESGHVVTSPHSGVTGWHSIAVNTTVEPDETVREAYALSTETHAIQPGSYEFTEEYDVRGGDPHEDGEEWGIEVEVRVKIERSDADVDEGGDVTFDMILADVAEVPDEFAGRLSIDVLEPVTNAHPGLVEITLENESDEREIMASPRGWPFGSYLGRGNGGSELVLITEHMYAPAYVAGGGPGGRWVPAFLPYVESTRGRSKRGFDPGETVSTRCLVLAHPENDAPPGTYTFEQGYADDAVEFTWGFDLALLDRDE